MTISALLLLLASILPTSTLAKIGNEQIDILHYAHLQAEVRGIDSDKFLALINCESKIEKRARGDYRNETGEWMAAGILQFWRKTFDKFSLKYDFRGNYTNPYDQIYLAALMIQDGGIAHWTNCARATGWKF